MFSSSSIYTSRTGAELKEVFCRLSEPRLTTNKALCMDMKPEAGREGIHLRGRTACDKISLGGARRVVSTQRCWEWPGMVG